MQTQYNYIPKSTETNWPVVALAGVAGVTVLGVAFAIYKIAEGAAKTVNNLPGVGKPILGAAF